MVFQKITVYQMHSNEIESLLNIYYKYDIVFVNTPLTCLVYVDLAIANNDISKSFPTHIYRHIFTIKYK